jgi:osmotically-inducible protein OsmY
VNAKLFDDNIMRGASISVDTFEGNVTLTGAVKNEKQIEHATAIVKSVYGVRKARNLTMIKK